MLAWMSDAMLVSLLLGLSALAFERSAILRRRPERYQMVYPEFSFHALEGNVVAIHRELLSSNKPGEPVTFHEISDVRISPERQKQGATYVGNWNCGPETYLATFRVFLVDANGNHSNTLDYAIHCNGG